MNLVSSTLEVKALPLSPMSPNSTCAHSLVYPYIVIVFLYSYVSAIEIPSILDSIYIYLDVYVDQISRVKYDAMEGRERVKEK